MVFSSLIIITRSLVREREIAKPAIPGQESERAVEKGSRGKDTERDNFIIFIPFLDNKS